MPELSAEQLARVLDLQLATERITWQRRKSRRQALRALSFLFLAIIILGALFAGYFLFSGMQGG